MFNTGFGFYRRLKLVHFEFWPILYIPELVLCDHVNLATLKVKLAGNYSCFDMILTSFGHWVPILQKVGDAF